MFKNDVDTSVVDNLISGTLAQAKVIPVTVAGGGVVKRGTLLFSEDGEEFVKYDPVADDPEHEIQAVLLADVNADDSDSNIGPAAFGGEFNQNVIETVMDFTLSAAAINLARAKQIFIAPMNPAPEAF